MKKYSIYIYTLLLLVVVFTSCDKEESLSFDSERTGVNFSSFTSEYAFASKLTTIDTVSIPFSINGRMENYVRHANFTILADSTDALDTEFEILSAMVDASSIEGTLRVMVTKNDLDSIPDRRIWLQTAEGEDFEAGIFNMQNHILTLTDRMPRPIGWTDRGRVTRYVLGEYSTSYYQWVIAATGETQFPYGFVVPGYNNDEKWTYAYKQVWKARLIDLLKEYNASIAPDVLIHSDGRLEGEPVQVGVYKR